MREDEVEALLRIDGAGLRVRHEYAGFSVDIWHPAPNGEFPRPGVDVVTFTGFSTQRQDAIAQAWQKYQQFMSTEVGRIHLSDHNGQLMFRI